MTDLIASAIHDLVGIRFCLTPAIKLLKRTVHGTMSSADIMRCERLSTVVQNYSWSCEAVHETDVLSTYPILPRINVCGTSTDTSIARRKHTHRVRPSRSQTATDIVPLDLWIRSSPEVGPIPPGK